ncbi:carbamoyltransferase [Patescibacteria group bacterium]
MIILGISCYYHDSAACILKNGRVIAAAEEERFSRKKHDNSFPEKAIEFCLNSLGIAINEVNIIVFYEKPIIKFERILSQHLEHFPKSRKVFVDNLASWLTEKLYLKKVLKEKCHYHGKVQFIPHHLTHAASSFYLSGFKKAAIVTMDGLGEWASTTMGVGDGKKIKIDKEIRFPHSLGLFYSTITAYLGFKVNNDEYKVMGLAGYGNPNKYLQHFSKLITTFKDGSFVLNMKYFDYSWANHMPSKHMEKLFGYPIRKKGLKIYNYHQDIAAALQKKLEEVVFNLLRAVYKKYKINNLCLAGGVALNSVVNGKIISNTPFKNIYIPPAPGDAGGAMGAALSVYYQHSNKNWNKDFQPYLGPGYSFLEIKKILDKYKFKYKWYKNKKKLIDKVSDLIIKEKIIAWFQGKMEWGPRALGNRSILASATKKEMMNILNLKIKHRESFRPFAPVILDKYIYKYFKADKILSSAVKYMLMVYPVTKKGKKEVPAIVHVNGSGRLQSISHQDNPLYFNLIDSYRKKTGIPIIINTSFNVRGEPIVCTPEDAVKCFLGTDIDFLAIGDFLVKKGKNV